MDQDEPIAGAPAYSLRWGYPPDHMISLLSTSVFTVHHISDLSMNHVISVIYQVSFKFGCFGPHFLSQSLHILTRMV